MSSKIGSRIVVLGCVVEFAVVAWLGCGSQADSTQASEPASMEAANQPAPPAAASESPPAPAMPAPAETASGRDGVGEPTALEKPAAPAPASNGGQSDTPAAPAEMPAPMAEEPPVAAPAPPSEMPAPPPAPPATVFPVSAGKPTVYLAGDSTVQTYGAAQAPQQGWGQRIAELFTTDVVFVNKSIGGRSSKSYIDEGRLDEIEAVIKQGDYLFAQWGINDRYRSDPTRFTDPATTFKQYLNMYIDVARSKNAIPVLVTPTPRLDFSNGAFQNGFVDYCAAIKEVGAATGTRVVDLQTKGLAYYTSIGLDRVVSTIILPPMDVLHFRDTGALQMARLVSEGVKESDLPIGKFVK